MSARESIYRFCNYQLRSHQETRNKLYEIGCKTPEVEELIAELIEKGLLNEEQYARAIARGRFRLKQWGRVKITQYLKINKVSDYCIKKAMTEIDADEYYETLQKLAAKKWAELKSEKMVHIRKNKTFRYLLQKGYEGGLINDVMVELAKK